MNPSDDNTIARWIAHYLAFERCGGQGVPALQPAALAAMTGAYRDLAAAFIADRRALAAREPDVPGVLPEGID